MPNIAPGEKKGRGRPATDRYWRERVAVLVENDELGPKPLTRSLGEEAARLGRRDAPAERTVARFRTEYLAKSDEARRGYRWFRWPESIGGELPWEASAALFDLCRHLRGARVTIRRARWFWRVTLAAPDTPIARRDYLASMLAAAEVLPVESGVVVFRCVEAAIRDSELPLPMLEFSAGTEPDDAAHAVVEALGAETSFVPGLVRFFDDMREHGSMSAAFDAQQAAKEPPAPVTRNRKGAKR